MLKYLYCLFFFLFFKANAQEMVTFSGQIKDTQTEETLPSATVYLFQDSIRFATLTDIEGNFSISIPKGNYKLKVNFIGYNDFTQEIDLQKNTRISVPINPAVETLKEVVVTADRTIKEIESTETGKMELSMAEIEKLPAIFGEPDAIKTIQMMPGIQTGSEAGTNLYVRGGSADQNMVMVDEAPVYSTGHLFGFFSVFNTEAINKMTLYKGNIPAKYSGRISSVLDFDMKEGNMDSMQVDGSLGLLSSKLAVNGPIKKDKLSYQVAVRRTYIDAITSPIEVRNGQKGIPYYFYDINTKLAWKLNPKNTLSWSFYNGKDAFKFNILDDRFKLKMEWQNTASTLAWKKKISDDFHSETFLIYNKFNLASTSTFDSFRSRLSSIVTEIHFKQRFNYYFTDKHHITTGVGASLSNYTPRALEASSSTQTETTKFEVGQTNTNFKSVLYQVFISDNLQWSKRFHSEIGLAFNYYTQLGPYIYNPANGPSTVYKNNETVIQKPVIEPRVGLNYTLDSSSSLKASFVVTNQFIHQTSLSGNNLPFDVWLPASKKLPPQRGWLSALGYYKNLKDGVFYFSSEVYYKQMFNQLEFRQDYTTKINGDFEDDLVVGKGKSYGLELFLQKRKGKTQGWIAYTLSKTTRTFPDLNGGKTFPFRYDRRHNVSLVLTHQLNPHWVVGGNFVYTTGQAATMPSNRYFIGGTLVTEYGAVNSYRYPAYHRMDLSLTYSANRNKRVKSTWALSVYNVYWRKNPYIIYVDISATDNQQSLSLTPSMVYLFGILPSLSWNFSF